MDKGFRACTGGGFAITNKVKLNFRFHNPNEVEETADYIMKIFVEVNKEKLQRILQKNVGGKVYQTAKAESHSE